MSDDTTLPDAVDVLVIGAGAIGLAVAYALASRGRETVVIEQSTVGTGTSWGNAGFVVPSHVLPIPEPGMFTTVLRSILGRSGPVTVRPVPSPALVWWVVRFLRCCRPGAVEAAAPVLAALGNLSADLYREWLAAEDIECAFVPNGLLNVFGDEAAFAKAQHRADWEARFGVRVQHLDAEEARAMEPSLNHSVVGALFYPDDAGLDPGRFLSGLAAAAVRRGARLFPATEAQQAEGDGDVVRRLITSRGAIRVREVVIAAGAASPRLARRFGIRLPIQPAKGYSITAKRPVRGPRRRMLLGEKYVAVAPMGDRLRLSGWLELARWDGQLPPQRLAQVERNARARLDMDAELTVTQRWAGHRPVTPDGLPILGRASGWRNVTIAAGHAMQGVMLAPATGHLIAQVLNDEPLDCDMARCLPARFQ